MYHSKTDADLLSGESGTKTVPPKQEMEGPFFPLEGNDFPGEKNDFPLEKIHGWKKGRFGLVLSRFFSPHEAPETASGCERRRYEQKNGFVRVAPAFSTCRNGFLCPLQQRRLAMRLSEGHFRHSGASWTENKELRCKDFLPHREH